MVVLTNRKSKHQLDENGISLNIHRNIERDWGNHLKVTETRTLWNHSCVPCSYMIQGWFSIWPGLASFECTCKYT
jgi:hypothetical protein